jgi:ketosteroid isomerase-like protein
MRRITLRLCVAIITFMVGSFAVGAWHSLFPTLAPHVMHLNAGSESVDSTIGQTAEQEIREIYRQYDMAQTYPDASFFEQMEAESFVLTTSDGRTYSKPQAIDLLKTYPKGIKYTTDDLHIQFEGNLAIVRGRLTATYLDTGDQYGPQWRWIDLLIKRHGRWQIISTTQVGL